MSKKKKPGRPESVEQSSLRRPAPMETASDIQPKDISREPTEKLKHIDARQEPPAPKDNAGTMSRPPPSSDTGSFKSVRDDLKTQELDNRPFRSYVPPASRQTEREEAVGDQSALRSKPKPPPARDRTGAGDTVRLQNVAPGPDRARPFGRPSRLRPRGPSRVAEQRPRIPTAAKFGFFSFVFGFIGLIFRMAIVTLLVMGIVGFISYEAIRHYIKTDPVIVPDVRGIAVSDAFDRLSEKKLSMVKEKSESSGLVAPGEIIDQEPVAGTKTKIGATVRVKVSSGRSNFVVPNVVNESRENAENRIKGARLEVGNITFTEDDRVPRDTVITQNPDAGKGLDQAGKVDLLISSGPKGSSLTMPDVTGQTVSEAKARLARVGVINVETDPPGAVNEIVVSQEPLVGKLIVQSQSVKLITRKQ